MAWPCLTMNLAFGVSVQSVRVEVGHDRLWRLVQVVDTLDAPVLDAGISRGDLYYVQGQLLQAQADGACLSHGMVTATELDRLGHIRGDSTAGPGDSGGGCFAADTGKLIGMIVGTDDIMREAVMVPAAVISALLNLACNQPQLA